MMIRIVRLRLIIITAIAPLIVRTIVAIILIRSTVVSALGGRVTIIRIIVRLVRWEVRVVSPVIVRVTELIWVRILIWVIGCVAALVWIEVRIALT